MLEKQPNEYEETLKAIHKYEDIIIEENGDSYYEDENNWYPYKLNGIPFEIGIGYDVPYNPIGREHTREFFEWAIKEIKFEVYDDDEILEELDRIKALFKPTIYSVERHVMFFARTSKVEIEQLEKFFTAHAIEEFIKYGYLKLITDENIKS